MIKSILIRDVLFYFRRPGELFFPLLFFVMICSLFAIAFPYGPQRLASIAPSVLWVVAILSIILSLEFGYRSDLQDGTLEQFIVSDQSLNKIILGKSLAHWLTTGLPLTLLAPVLALSMQLSWAGILGLVATFVIGMPALSLLTTIGVALTLGLHRGGIFLSILMLPLLMPILLLGTSGVYAASLGLNWSGHLALLGACFLLSVCFAPMVIAAALRISVQTG